MSNNRILAVVVGACALAVSALLALPMGEGASETADLPGTGVEDLTLRRPATATVESSDEAHASLPRLWLGSPVAR